MSDLRWARYDLPAVDERGPMAMVIPYRFEWGDEPKVREALVRQQCDAMGYPQPDVIPEPTELESAKVTAPDGTVIDIHEEMMERWAAEHPDA